MFQCENNNNNNDNQQENLFRASLNTGPRGGVSIKNIKKNINIPNQNQNPPPNPTPNFNPNQTPNFNQNPNQNIKQDDNASIESKKANNVQKIRNIASCINDKLLNNNLTETEKDNLSESDENDEIEYKIEKTNVKNKMLGYLKDIILIVIIYVVLSQDFLKKKIAEYIPNIANSNIHGSIIFGILHATLYLTFRAMLKSH